MKDSINARTHGRMTATTLNPMAPLYFMNRTSLDPLRGGVYLEPWHRSHYPQLQRDEVAAALAITELSNRPCRTGLPTTSQGLSQVPVLMGQRDAPATGRRDCFGEEDMLKYKQIAEQVRRDRSNQLTEQMLRDNTTTDFEGPMKRDFDDENEINRMYKTIPAVNIKEEPYEMLSDCQEDKKYLYPLTSNHESQSTPRLQTSVTASRAPFSGRSVNTSPTSLSDVSAERWTKRNLYTSSPRGPLMHRYSNSTSPRKSPEDVPVYFNEILKSRVVIPPALPQRPKLNLAELTALSTYGRGAGFNSSELFGSLTQEHLGSSRAEPAKRDSPADFLKRKQQRKVVETRGRMGWIRNLRLKRNFGSLSSLSLYYKNMSLKKNQQSAAIDLSINKKEQKVEIESRTFADKKVNDLKNSPIAVSINNNLELTRLKPHERLFPNAIHPSALFVETAESRLLGIKEHGGVRSGSMSTQRGCHKRRPSSAGSSCTQIGGHAPQNSSKKSDPTSREPTQSPPTKLDCHLPFKKRRLVEDHLSQEISENMGGNSAPSSPAERESSPVLSPKGDCSPVSISKGEYEITPDEDGDLPLHIAVVHGQVNAVEKFVEKMEKRGVSVDTYNNQKQTALHLAVIAKQPEVLTSLLRHNASLSLLDKKGNTPLHLAVKYGSTACMNILLSQQYSSLIDLDAMNFDGLTPLHMAVQYGHDEILATLLGSGAKVNARDGKSGRTALYFAAESDNMTATKILLACGADAHLPSYAGHSPAQVAAGRSNLELLELLEPCK